MLSSYVRTVCGAALVALAAFGCGGGSSTDPDDDDNNNNDGDDPVVTTAVAVRDNNSFNPDYIRVSPGATVTWTWEGTTDEDHNITFSDPAIPDASDRDTGTHQATFAAAGTYNYSCTHHAGMDGRVLVQ